MGGVRQSCAPVLSWGVARWSDNADAPGWMGTKFRFDLVLSAPPRAQNDNHLIWPADLIMPNSFRPFFLTPALVNIVCSCSLRRRARETGCSDKRTFRYWNRCTRVRSSRRPGHLGRDSVLEDLQHVRLCHQHTAAPGKSVERWGGHLDRFRSIHRWRI